MLKCFKHYKSYIHIAYYILDIVQQNKSKFTMEQPYILSILYCQYHACWCPGDLQSQGISRRGDNQIRWNIPSLAWEEFLTLVCRTWSWVSVSCLYSSRVHCPLLPLSQLCRHQPQQCCYCWQTVAVPSAANKQGSSSHAETRKIDWCLYT